ncbi:hypothetical protein [Aquimarina sp. AU474]|uniref:hypothetical protein n=1 Tax=Aquimarina sp. AU474 TaxID=2108529 RepID=UPI000D6940C5|nr:hypothetical protein [Aquimarina sp. AU474]
MRRLNSFFIFIISSASILGQSTFDRSIDASGLNEIIIILDNTFQVEITNTQENKIIYNAVSEGEYQDHVLIKTARTQKTLTIKDDLQPFSIDYNDKLSAHKVMAVKIVIQIPSHIGVTIKSNIATLTAKGTYKNLFVELNSGDCIIDHFMGNATINTLTGDIKLSTKNAIVNTITKSGKLNVQKIYGEHKINLSSISGDISVCKTK